MTESSVLVTGGAGYIGSHVVLALRHHGWPVVVIDDLSTGLRRLVPDVVELVEASVADRAAVEAVFRAHRVGAVVHLAGSIVVPDSIARPLDYYANNTLASHALIGAALACGVRHFLFSSTAAVYGEPVRVPIDENDPTRPINPYGASKLMVERMLADAGAAHGLAWGALRYFNVAGADPEGRSGQAGGRSTHLVRIAAEAVCGKRGHVAVYGDDYDTSDGTCVRDYIHVSDLAEAHVAALEALVARPGEPLLLNCGYGRGFSVREVLAAAERVSGMRLDIRVEGRRAGDPAVLVAGNRRLLDTLDWTARYDDLDRIVADAIRWERSLP
ncbi:UDP-glucose 4-epimerase GalE [Sphingomonas sp. ASV193]|uniref:UDP-glucose 4-epimerase GalE n=1 Tax=Sphingomonas sp. ASV193 TaxID=3144405 RepID=UPI0032E8C705